MKKISKKNRIILGILFILITILIYSYVNKNVLGLMNNYSGYENEATAPSRKTVDIILPRLDVVFIPYLIFTILGYIIKIKPRTIFFPLSITTIDYLIITRGTIIAGASFGWIVIFLLIPFLEGICASLVAGIILDVAEYKSNKKKSEI